MRCRRSALLLVLALGGVGCGLGFDPPSLLAGGPRILALRATPPDARPGELVTLDALVWPEQDREGAAAVDSWEWRVCALASSLGMGMAMGAAGAQLPASCFDPRLDDESFDLGTGPSVVVPAILPDGIPAWPSSCGALDDAARVEQGGRELWLSGLRVTVSLRVTAGGATEVANKRVILRPAAEAIPEDQQGRPFRTPRLCEDVAEAGRLCAANANPAPPRLETPNGEWPGRGPITVAPGDKVKLRPLEPEAGDRQAYVALHNCWEVIDDPGLLETGGEYEREETRFWAWYADAGSLLPTDTALGDEPATRDAAWEAPREPGSYTLWVVERDGRGGVAWQDWELRVAEDAGQ